ncbi:hypothetical protein N4R57_06270 [Rhodobacteraceae bacterium D3-12]|nr:hypothetical protein N4R57_06270 [Rhodobacteraceae bacterium D3-12]
MGNLVTFDWNCILSIENGDANFDSIQLLIDAHHSGGIEVGLLATSASENMRGTKGFPGSYLIFEKRLARLGLSDFPIIPAPGVIGLTFIGHSYWCDEETYENLSNSLWDVIAPRQKNFVEEWVVVKDRAPTDDEFQSSEFAKYRNAWCDVHSAYCHVAEERDYFITSNTKDFPPDGAALSQLGLLALTPEMAVARLL